MINLIVEAGDSLTGSPRMVYSLERAKGVDQGFLRVEVAVNVANETTKLFHFWLPVIIDVHIAQTRSLELGGWLLSVYVMNLKASGQRTYAKTWPYSPH